MEFWDIYDSNRNKINKVIQRDGIQRLGLGEYHLVVEAIIINDNNKILIGKRAKNKKNYPLYWECNGGSVKSGESSQQGILREIYEELGINFKNDDAILYKSIRDDSIKAFKDFWIFKRNIDINSIKFIDKETIEAKWVSIDELEKMKENNEFMPRSILNREEMREIVNRLEFIEKSKKDRNDEENER